MYLVWSSLRTRLIQYFARVLYFFNILISHIRQQITVKICNIGFHGNRYRSFDTVRSRQFMIDHNEERISNWILPVDRLHVFEIDIGRPKSIEHGIQIDIRFVWRLTASNFPSWYYKTVVSILLSYLDEKFLYYHILLLYPDINYTYLLGSVLNVRVFCFFDRLVLFCILSDIFIQMFHLHWYRIRNLRFFARNGTAAGLREAVVLRRRNEI